MFVAERFFPIQTDFTLEPSGLMPLSVSLYTLQETTFQQDMIGYPTPPSEPPEDSPTIWQLYPTILQ
jgi:hypothetical protein